MSIETWMVYALAVLILTASPGPSSLLCMTKGVVSGWRRAFATALGSLTAITGIMTLSFTGLGVLIASSEIIFNVVKWLGAAYLAYLGLKALTSTQDHYEMTNGESIQVAGYRSHYVSGFIVGASNPKAILFFTALFPQFIDPQAELFSQYAIFASTFMIMELSWLCFYAYLGAKSSTWILAKGRAKLFNRLTGGVFVGAGAWLSTVSRT
ncbi:LysE family translocator [Vibrio fluvialis]|nr:LysE family translocator [Vibrio fluvialis]EKO3482639.1 LysE family translocator [Vibrio fluvialis]MBY7807144.1 LysE family translocator [Vibrio fluvialis]MBY7820419.1 LysE family translocator [Vibrio fluvialis]MBY7867181.1 LysE family translocator [Vibrio fluvialis]